MLRHLFEHHCLVRWLRCLHPLLVPLLNYLHVFLREGCHVNKVVCAFFLYVDDCFFVDRRALSVVNGRNLFLNEARVSELVDGFAVVVRKKLVDAFIWLPDNLAFLSHQFD